MNDKPRDFDMGEGRFYRPVKLVPFKEPSTPEEWAEWGAWDWDEGEESR